jgi:hypothetical protein
MAENFYSVPEGAKYVENKDLGEKLIPRAFHSKYTGYTVNETPNGHGTLTVAGGEIYEGNFKDGKKEGEFKVTLTNGKEKIIYYKDGNFIAEELYKNPLTSKMEIYKQAASDRLGNLKYKVERLTRRHGGKRTKKSKKELRKKRKTMKKRRG